MSKFRNVAAAFVDTMAGVVYNEEEEEGREEDEDEDEEDEEIDNVSSHATPLRSVQFDVNETSEFAEEIGRHALERARMERAIKERRELESPILNPYLSKGLIHLEENLPGPEDMTIFAVRVKTGKEEVVTLRLINKAFEAKVEGIEGIACIFSVPRAPGRIYIEAQSIEQIRSLCKGIHFVFPISPFVVPIDERVALLQGRVRSGPLIKKGTVVKVRNGRYKDDVGRVISVAEGQDRVTLKIKSREPIPGDLKRKRSARRDAYILKKDLAKSLGRSIDFEDLLPKEDLDDEDLDDENLSECKKADEETRDNDDENRSEVEEAEEETRDLDDEQKIETEEEKARESFRFKNKIYSRDGHLLLDIPYDRVQRVDAFLQLDDLTDLTSSSVSQLKLPKFLHVGTRVWFIGGEMIGATGYIVEFPSSGKVLVDLGNLDIISESAPNSTFLYEADLKDMVRRFDIGDEVLVKMGALKGRHGMVAFVEVDKGIEKAVLNLIEQGVPGEIRGLRVPFEFVDSYDKPDEQVSPFDHEEIWHGKYVIISKGKHEGKTGVVAVVERYHFRIVEDGTSIELRVPKGVVRKSEKTEYPFGHPGRPTTPKKMEAQEFPEFLSNGNNPIDVDLIEDEPEEEKCIIDHRTDGFDGQQVYVFRGSFKGKLARVLSMSGGLVKVEFDSAIRGSGILFIQANYVFAKCACTLGDGSKPPWSKTNIKNIPNLFDRTIVEPPIPRSATPSVPPGEEESHESEQQIKYHDSNGKGMWLFDERIAHLRKTYSFLVKIEVHRDLDVAGRRNGLVLRDPNAPTSPFPETTPANVLIEYKDRKQEIVVESLPVSTLRVTAPSKDEKHLIVKGECTGEIVIHKKTEGKKAFVYIEGTDSKKDGFRVLKSDICLFEIPT